MILSELTYTESNFKPVIPVTISPIHKIRITVTGSLNNKIPNITVPNVPIPVQTA